MAVVTVTDLSSYIKSMAESVKTARDLVSSGSNPMMISDFRFKANISGQVATSASTGTSLNIARLSIREQVMTQYRGEWGLEVQCTIVAVV